MVTKSTFCTAPFWNEGIQLFCDNDDRSVRFIGLYRFRKAIKSGLQNGVCGENLSADREEKPQHTFALNCHFSF